MRTIRSITELTEEEIRTLLRAKLRKSREKRLQTYRRTGRAITLVREFEPDEQPLPDIVVDMTNLAGAAHFRSGMRNRFANHLLGLAEAGAMVGVVILLWLGWQNLSTLNQRASAVWIFPTPTPTPLIQAVVLPDGHTPPDRSGSSRPNVQEVPAHLRPLIQVYASLPTPTAAPQQGVRIQIPALNIDSPIVQGDGWEQLMKGVAQHLGTANPGEKGNMVLSGHNDVYGEVFRYLDRLKPGDPVIIFTYTKKYTYIVEGWKLVNPDQVDVMDPTPDETLTLISCYPYLIDTQRIVVKARFLRG